MVSSLKATVAPPANSSTIVSPKDAASHVLARSSWLGHSETTQLGSGEEAVKEPHVPSVGGGAGASAGAGGLGGFGLGGDGGGDGGAHAGPVMKYCTVALHVAPGAHCALM